LGVEGDAARFLVAGLRATHLSFGGSGVRASLFAGRSVDQGGGDFFSGSVEGMIRVPLGGGWSAGAEFRGFGFEVADPFPYRALGLEGGPELRLTGRHVYASLKGIAGKGWSRTELRRYAGGPVRVVEDDLWRYGVTGEFLVGSRRVMGGVSGGIHESLGGTYRSGGLRILVTNGGPALEARLDAWKTPLGAETIAGVALVLPWGDWSLRGFLGRTEPDPLMLAEPSAGAGGLFVARRILGTGPLGETPPSLHEIVEYSTGLATVRFEINPPSGVEHVGILGDFSYWEPIPMVRKDDVWTVELEVSVGTYHFGFMVDGEWYVPAQAPDLVSDEWGRMNATLVIEEG
jgi:hypothetical protein